MRNRTPPSGVSVRFGSGRTCFNCGAIHFRQTSENTTYFECVSIWVKGGWKETRGVWRPISAKRPVSESRMTSLNPFELKRKKARNGASSWVREWFMAVRQGFEPWRRSPAYTLSRRAPSTTRPPHRAGGVAPRLGQAQGPFATNIAKNVMPWVLCHTETLVMPCCAGKYGRQTL